MGANVDVKPWWNSSTVWTQVVAFGAMFATVFGFDMTPEQQAAIAAGIAGVANAVTIVLRIFFTKSVTPSVAKKL